jgi:hypothetical protein
MLSKQKISLTGRLLLASFCLLLSDPENGGSIFLQNPINDIINYITEAEDSVRFCYQAMVGEDIEYLACAVVRSACISKIVIITRSYDV